jgi:hypothetical protein
MSTNNMLLTIGAFVILTSILHNIYGILAVTGDDIAEAQDMILANTIATSYLEIAQGLAFDHITDTSDIAIGKAALLTDPYALGPDDSAEDSIGNFTDFDDFNGLVLEKRATGSDKRFKTFFRVSYVDPNNVDAVSTIRTFVKRIDLKVWRSFPPSKGASTDTLRMSHAMGYFHFD